MSTEQEHAAMRVAFFGDSICVGQGVSIYRGWVTRIAVSLERIAEKRNCEIIVTNASVNGNTTRQALERMPYEIQSHGVDVLLVQFGLNDCNYWVTDGGLPRVMRRRRTNLWRELMSLRELVRLYRAEKPNLVHHVAMKPVINGSIAAKLAKVPRVVNALAGLGYVFASSGLGAWLMRPFVRVALKLSAGASTWVIVQNPDDKRLLQRLQVADSRIAVIRGSGVDPETFTPTPEPEGRLVVCMVSRMLWDKGVGVLVAAARELRADRPDIRVVLVGTPDPENPASIPEMKLRTWQLEGVIEWLGHQQDIPAIWARSHIAVLPSYYGEGLPKSLTETAACGRPLIAADAPGCREIVADGETGLLVPVRDAPALADAIRRLAANRALRARLGQRAREWAVERFSEARVVHDTLELYRSVLSHPCPLSPP